MFKTAPTSIDIKPGKYPHTGWVDISGKGVWTEVAVMSVDQGGSLHFFPLTALDRIDRQRFFNIITSRVAGSFPLYDLCAQTTLGNGVNALTYFQQLVKVLTVSGQVLEPRVGQRGGMFTPSPQQPRTTLTTKQSKQG
jgi:hypothetical protein